MHFTVGQRVYVDGRDPGTVTSVNSANEMYDVQLDTGYRVRKHVSRLSGDTMARQNSRPPRPPRSPRAPRGARTRGGLARPNSVYRFRLEDALASFNAEFPGQWVAGHADEAGWSLRRQGVETQVGYNLLLSLGEPAVRKYIQALEDKGIQVLGVEWSSARVKPWNLLTARSVTLKLQDEIEEALGLTTNKQGDGSKAGAKTRERTEEEIVAAYRATWADAATRKSKQKHEFGISEKRQKGVEQRQDRKAIIDISVIEKQLKSSHAMFMVRSDPPRMQYPMMQVSGGAVQPSALYTGNPVDGQAYFILIDPDLVSSGAHFLTEQEVADAGGVQLAAESFVESRGGGEAKVYEINLDDYGGRMKVRSLPSEISVAPGMTKAELARRHRLARMTPPVTASGDARIDAYVQDNKVFYVYTQKLSRGKQVLESVFMPLSPTLLEITDGQTATAVLKENFGPPGESGLPPFVEEALKSGMVFYSTPQKAMGLASEADLMALQGPAQIVIGSRAKGRNPNFSWVPSFEPMSWISDTGTASQYPPQVDPAWVKALRTPSREPVAELDRMLGRFARGFSAYFEDSLNLTLTQRTERLLKERSYLAAALAKFANWMRKGNLSVASMQAGYSPSLVSRATLLGLITYPAKSSRDELPLSFVPMLVPRLIPYTPPDPPKQDPEAPPTPGWTWGTAVLGFPSEDLPWRWVPFDSDEAAADEVVDAKGNATGTYLAYGDILVVRNGLKERKYPNRPEHKVGFATPVPELGEMGGLLPALYRLLHGASPWESAPPRPREPVEGMGRALLAADISGLPPAKPSSVMPGLYEARDTSIAHVVRRYITAIGPTPEHVWVPEAVVRQIQKENTKRPEPGLNYKALREVVEKKWKASFGATSAYQLLIEDLRIAEELTGILSLRALQGQLDTRAMQVAQGAAPRLVGKAEDLAKEEYAAAKQAWERTKRGLPPVDLGVKAEHLKKLEGLNQRDQAIVDMLIKEPALYRVAQAALKASTTLVENAIFYRALNWDPETKTFRWLARGFHTEVPEDVRISEFRTGLRAQVREMRWGKGAQFFNLGGRSPIMYKTYNKALFLLTKRLWAQAWMNPSQDLITPDEIKRVDQWGFYAQTLALLQQWIAEFDQEDFEQLLAQYGEKVKRKNFPYQTHLRGKLPALGALCPLGAGPMALQNLFGALSVDVDAVLRRMKGITQDEFLSEYLGTQSFLQVRGETLGAEADVQQRRGVTPPPVTVQDVLLRFLETRPQGWRDLAPAVADAGLPSAPDLNFIIQAIRAAPADTLSKMLAGMQVRLRLKETGKLDEATLRWYEKNRAKPPAITAAPVAYRPQVATGGQVAYQSYQDESDLLSDIDEALGKLQK